MLLKSFHRLLKRSTPLCCGCYKFIRIGQCAILPINQPAPIFALYDKGFPYDVLQKKNVTIPPIFNSLSFRYYKNIHKVIERENIWTIPNILCVTRMIISPYLGHLILNADFLQAFYFMIFAGMTDLLDGFIARNWYNQSSKLGSFLDPMADKILMVTVVTTMTYSELIPYFLTFLIIARDVSLVAAAFYIRYVSLPPPRTLSRYFDASHATAQLAPTFISKLNTVVQLSTVAVTLTASVFSFTDHPVLPFLWYCTAATTIASAASYIFSKNTYRILKPRPSIEKER